MLFSMVESVTLGCAINRIKFSNGYKRESNNRNAQLAYWKDRKEENEQEDKLTEMRKTYYARGRRESYSRGKSS